MKLLALIGPAQISGLIIKTYIMAAIFGVIILGLAILFSNLIKIDPRPNASDAKKRRVVFWVLSVLTPVLFYLYNFFVVMKTIKKGPAQNMFQSPAAISSVVALITIIALGFILSKSFKGKKIGNWFPTKKS